MDIDIARLAAFIDGEGYIGVVKRKDDKSFIGYRYTPRVQITNSNYILMDWLNFMFDFDIVDYKDPRPNCKIQYKAYAENAKAISIAKSVLPLLLLKKQQATKIIEFWENTKWTKGIRVPPEITEERERLYLHIRQLNS